MIISTIGINKVALMVALYNASSVRTSGPICFDPMTQEMAENMLSKHAGYFYYFAQRVLGVNLLGDKIETYQYNQRNGQDAAEYIIDELFIKRVTSNFPYSIDTRRRR